jgi:ABC-type uncharacterized transport system permease subunit
MTDRDPALGRTTNRFRFSGATFLLLSGALAGLGALVYLLGTATATWVEGLGVVFMSIAVAPTILGAVLLVIALATGRASERKPFA